MHISEGVLSPEVLTAGAVLACAGIAMGLRTLKDKRLVTTGLMSAAFFVGSLIHVPVGPGNVHLLLVGLIGMLLGWAAFPAICVALILQAVLFQFGGITVLGVNTVTMALPAVCCHYAFRRYLCGTNVARSRLAAFLCGSVSVAGSCLLTALALALTSEAFLPSATLLLLAHIPVIIIEGCLSVFLIGFLQRVRPDILNLSAETN
ncbi:MAG: cobalt transporter CbiM [Desulfovibrionaceae bacterium]|nr:cobalt transporter CbiM [Desulfovibrionaceae bacterium]